MLITSNFHVKELLAKQSVQILVPMTIMETKTLSSQLRLVLQEMILRLSDDLNL